MTETWDFTPPPPSSLGDHEVPAVGDHLAGKRVALLITGGIAAMKAPLVARALRRQGAEVVAFVSAEGLRYVTADTLEWSTVHPVITRLTPAAEHLSDDSPFDAYLVAPATYNTINKIAAGIADSLITSAVASAIGRMEQEADGPRVLVAPTMHGSLHNSILTASLQRLVGLGVRMIPPRQDYGKHNLPDEPVLVAEICRAVSASPLAGRKILVTGGPTPVPIDAVRRLTNKFRGELGALVAEELYLRGADVRLVHGEGSYRPPDHLPWRPAHTYDEYRDAVLEELAEGCEAAVFSAAVADYRPEQPLSGKTPSGGTLELELVPTEKVVRLARERFADLHMVTFKYQEEVDHDELLAIARKRLELGYQAVVANRGEERGPDGEQVAWLVTGDGEPQRAIGKPAIARRIAEHLEAALD